MTVEGAHTTDRTRHARSAVLGACCVVIAYLALASACAAQQVIDRIVATVNGQPILLSEWEVEMRFEALLDAKPLPMSDDDARAALNRLIDHELLRQQFRTYRVADPSAPEVDQQMMDLRKQIGATADAAFRALLARYGLSENEFRERASNQVAMLHFIDLRLRPSVHLDRRTIETYYYETLVPELKRKGEKPPPLAEVTPQIVELLSQERVNVLTADWLKDLRQQSKVHIEEAVGMPAKPSQTGSQ